MNNCILVEFVGIPYSWKTTTMNELQRQLRNEGVSTYAVQEFRGAREFYEQRKLSPDINFLRSLNFMAEFVQVARDERTQVVLVDRGLYDSLCWLEWFQAEGIETSSFCAVVRGMVDVVSKYASKYRIVWMDRDPLLVLGNHGPKAGRIVNFETLAALQGIYSSRFGDLNLPGSFHRVDSDGGNSTQIATGLLSTLKLA